MVAWAEVNTRGVSRIAQFKLNFLFTVSLFIGQTKVKAASSARSTTTHRNEEVEEEEEEGEDRTNTNNTAKSTSSIPSQSRPDCVENRQSDQKGDAQHDPGDGSSSEHSGGGEEEEEEEDQYYADDNNEGYEDNREGRESSVQSVEENRSERFVGVSFVSFQLSFKP